MIEAAHLAFADRAKYVGDQSGVPVSTLLSDTYAAERACKIDPLHAFAPPVAAGNVAASDGSCATPNSKAEAAPDTEGVNTTNLTVADKDGNVVEYTLTIEQTGGSGIVLPGRGFLLNNELTDFSAVYDPADPNRIEPGKRPRSSMSPTIVLQGKKPVLALGSPGGSTIITTVLGILVNRLDLGMSLEQAIAAPRAAPQQHDAAEGRAGLPRPLRRRADRARPHAHAGRRTRHVGGRDRRGHRDRVRPGAGCSRRPPNPPAAAGERRPWSSRK